MFPELFRNWIYPRAASIYALLGAALLALSSCQQPRGADACCTFTDVPRHAGEMSDQGAVQVDGSTTAHFYAFDETGAPAGHQSLNQILKLPPGKYTITVNDSRWTVHVEAGILARCATGTLLVAGNTGEPFQVTDSAGTDLASETLGKQMSFFPGSYRVSVNNTESNVQVRLRQLTELKTGTLMVLGNTGEYYYVLNNKHDQLNYNTFGKPLAFLPGSYPVKVNKTTMTARVFAGEVTTLATGSVLVKGLTDEHYYVTDTLGNALNFQRLNKALAFFPGPVHITVNNTLALAQVTAGATAEFDTGSLLLAGAGTSYYYVLDDDGNPLTYTMLNKSLSFFPAEYIVKIGANMRKATVYAAQETSIDAFHVSD